MKHLHDGSVSQAGIVTKGIGLALRVRSTTGPALLLRLVCSLGGVEVCLRTSLVVASDTARSSRGRGDGHDNWYGDSRTHRNGELHGKERLETRLENKQLQKMNGNNDGCEGEKLKAGEEGGYT